MSVRPRSPRRDREPIRPHGARGDMPLPAPEIADVGVERALLARGDGRPVVMEVELIEPTLFLHLAPDAARRLAAVLRSAAG